MTYKMNKKVSLLVLGCLKDITCEVLDKPNYNKLTFDIDFFL